MGNLVWGALENHGPYRWDLAYPHAKSYIYGRDDTNSGMVSTNYK